MWNVNIKMYFIVLKLKLFLNSFRQVLSKHKLCYIVFTKFYSAKLSSTAKTKLTAIFCSLLFSHFFVCFRVEKGFREINFYFPFDSRQNEELTLFSCWAALKQLSFPLICCQALHCWHRLLSSVCWFCFCFLNFHQNAADKTAQCGIKQTFNNL